MSAPKVFNGEHYERLNISRAEVLREILRELTQPLGLRTAIDIGCGLGFFSQLMSTLGLQVTAVDGRHENIEEGKKRYPNIRFLCFDVQDPSLLSLGEFDLVLCFGLLYHLENPLLAVRHLQAITTQLLIAESVTFPGEEPVMALIDEELHEDQGLNHVAFYPTEPCLIKMFYRAGYPFVYALIRRPAHPDFEGARVRTVLAASKQPIISKLVQRVFEPRSAIRPWDACTRPAPKLTPVQKLQRFVEKPLPEKVKTIKHIMGGK